jgi:hypothetical protein
MGGSPDHALPILINIPESLTPGAVGIMELFLIDLEIVTIVTVKPVQRREPHKALAILDNAPDAAFGEAIFGGQVLKSQVFFREFRGDYRLIASLPIGGRER